MRHGCARQSRPLDLQASLCVLRLFLTCPSLANQVSTRIRSTRTHARPIPLAEREPSFFKKALPTTTAAAARVQRAPTLTRGTQRHARHAKAVCDASSPPAALVATFSHTYAYVNSHPPQANTRTKREKHLASRTAFAPLACTSRNSRPLSKMSNATHAMQVSLGASVDSNCGLATLSLTCLLKFARHFLERGKRADVRALLFWKIPGPSTADIVQAVDRLSAGAARQF